MHVVYKIWLDLNGMAFGEGPYRLLKGVETTGSLLQAATAMEMTYRKALHLITGCERTLGFALMRRTIGGLHGGGSQLTRRAVKLMVKYEQLRAQAEETLAEAYRKHFGEPAEVLHKVTIRTRKPVK